MDSSAQEPTMGQAAELGRMVNEVVERYLASQTERPITDPMSVAELRDLLDEPLPRAGSPCSDVLQLFEERIMAHTTASTSPGYFGLMNPTPTPIAIWADALISAMNQNQAASHHSPAGSVVEETVIRWLGEATGYGAGCHGHLTSGGTVANLTALKFALHRAAPEVRKQGLLASGRRLAVYTSDQVHFSVDRSADLLGLGQQALRKVRARPDATADVEAFANRIARDREEGWEALAIVGIAGSTAAGAVDPLDELADLAAESGCWLHVDAAYGGAAGLSREYPGILNGIERADSVTVDAHKWFFVPFVAGGILHRDPELEIATFRMDAGYIPPTGGPGIPPTDYYQRGVAGTRRFNALKVWMSLKHMGADWYAEVVDRQLRLAREVEARIAAMPDWEVATPATTAIVTFRYIPPTLRGDLEAGGEQVLNALKRCDKLQDRIAADVQADGRFWISSAPLPGGKGLRFNLISYLTDEARIDAFLSLLPGAAAKASEALL